MRNLKGANAVVVGGGSGIGRGIAQALARRGVNLLVADVRGPTAAATARECEALGVRTASAQTDVTHADQVDALVQLAYGTFPRVDILVNSAGISLHKRLEDANPEDWRRILDVNLFGIIQTCRSFVPRLKAQGPGLAHIVNNASMAALVTHAIPGLGLYTVSKQALLAYTEALAQEEAASGITVSLLACGRIATGLGVNSQDYLDALDEGRAPVAPEAAAADGEMMSAEDAGEIVAQGIEQGLFLILTHPERRPEVAERYGRLLAEIESQNWRAG